MATADTEMSFRVVALRLHEAHRADDVRAVVFASSSAGEGTTTVLWKTAEQLQTVYGARVTILELGCRKSGVSPRLSQPAPHTSREWLANRLPAKECLGRSAAGCGVIPTDATPHSIDPSALERALPDLLETCDLLLIDAPPVLSGSEALSILSVVPRIVLVCEEGHTRIEVLERLQRELATRRVEILGSVLNKHRRVIPQWLYKAIAR